MRSCTLQVIAVLSCLVLLVSCAEKKEEEKKEVKEEPKKEGGKEEREGRANVSDDALMTALKDKRYLMRQLKCALGEGPCDPVGRKIKTYAPLILRGSCPKCSPQEVRQIQQVLSHVQRYYPKEWGKILKQFTGQQ